MPEESEKKKRTEVHIWDAEEVETRPPVPSQMCACLGFVLLNGTLMFLIKDT